MKLYEIRELARLFKAGRRKRRWHNLHSNSDTIPMNDFDFSHVSLGYGSYGELNVVDFGGENRLIIKNYVSIAQHVTFVVNAEHHIVHISTYPFKAKMLQLTDSESFGKDDILIDDDVWIGYDATILSGVHIHQGAVVAAGAVVSHDIPPYAIVGGVPAKVIKYRFCPEVIDYMLTLDYGKLEEYMIREHINDLYKTINDMPLDKIKELYSWFPKKGQKL